MGPSLWMCPGMMPILALPGEMRPGQFGPMSRLVRRPRNALTRTMSVTGTPSVMQTTSGMPASVASMMASAAAGGGTKMSAQSAPVALTASSTVFQTAKPSWVVPPLPGVTPPTTCVPYSLQRSAWKVPSLPVIPCTRTFVALSTMMLMLAGRLRELDRLLGPLAHVVGHHEGQARFREHLLALLDIGAFGAQHHGELQAQLLHGGDDALGEAIDAQDAPEDVDEDGLDGRIGGEDAEGILDLLRRGAASHVEEVGGLPARKLDDVHGRHGEPRPIDHAAHTAVQLDVVEPVLRRLDVEGRLLFGVAQGHDLLVAVERVVVEVELGVERHDPPVARHHERVDLGERAVLLEIGAEEVEDQPHAGLELLAAQTQAEGEIPRLEGLEREGRVRALADDLLRMSGRHLFDLHAAGLRSHDHVGALAAVEGHGQVELGGDGRSLLDQHLEDLDALGGGLGSLEHHAENLFRGRLSRGRADDQLHAARLAPPARVHLRFDHDLAPELGRDRLGLPGRVGDVPVGHGDTVLAKDRLALILVDLHRLGFAGELAREPHDRVVLLGHHPFFEGNQSIIRDVDVLGADLGAALGDVAVAEAGLGLSEVEAVIGVERMHLELGDAHEIARSREGGLVLRVIADDVADVLAEEALDALAEFLAALDVLLLHAPGAVRLLRPRLEGGDLPGLLVVEGDVGGEGAKQRGGPDGRHRDRLVGLEGVHARHAHEARLAVDLGATRATLARLAVPAAGEVARLRGLDGVDDVEYHHAFLRLHPIVLEGAALRVAAPHPHRHHGGGHHFLSWSSVLSSGGISGRGSSVTLICPVRLRMTMLTLPRRSSAIG